MKYTINEVNQLVLKQKNEYNNNIYDNVTFTGLSNSGKKYENNRRNKEYQQEEEEEEEEKEED